MNMNLEEIKNTAFASWMKSVEPHIAVDHLYECLRSSILDGDTDENIAWELMKEVHGDKFYVNQETITRAYVTLVGDS